MVEGRTKRVHRRKVVGGLLDLVIYDGTSGSEVRKVGGRSWFVEAWNPSSVYDGHLPVTCVSSGQSALSSKDREFPRVPPTQLKLYRVSLCSHR